MDIIGILGSIASIASAIYAFLAWKKADRIAKDMRAEKERQDKKIIVTLSKWHSRG